MGKFRTLDAQGDFTFGKGLNNYSQDTAAVKLDIATRLRGWLKDCFFALDEGIDWNTYMSTGEINLLAEQIRTLIIQTPEVAQLLGFDFGLSERVFTAHYNVLTIYSENFRATVTELI